MSFSTLGLSDALLRAVADQGYTIPTPIQLQAIPAVLAFNFFVRRVKSVTADLDDFANDFQNLAQHAVLRVERRPQEVHRLQPVRVQGSN